MGELLKTSQSGGKLSPCDIEANFDDLHPPLNDQQVNSWASRCLFCYDAPCITACPTAIDIPRFIRQIATDNVIGAAKTILSANIMGGTCARACPTEILCEQQCVLNTGEQEPIEIGALQRHAVDHLMDSAKTLHIGNAVKQVKVKEAMIIDKKRHGSKDQQYKIMIEVLNAVDLKEDMLQRFPHEFSGGERQRIAIARALIVNPQLLILDEAVSSLDVITQAQIIKLLKDLQKKYDVTYLFISHNLKIVKKITDNIAVMYKGKIVELASVYNIFNNPLHPYTQELLQAAVEYKAVVRKQDIELSAWGHLVEQEVGHYVYQNY